MQPFLKKGCQDGNKVPLRKIDFYSQLFPFGQSRFHKNIGSRPWSSWSSW